MAGSFRAFGERDLREYRAMRNREVQERIEREREEYLLSVNEADYVQYLVSEYAIDIPVIDFEGVSVSSEARMIRAEEFPRNFNVYEGKSYSRIVAVYYLPVSGDVALLRYQPSCYLMWSADISVNHGYLCFDVLSFSESADEIKSNAQPILNNLRSQYSNLRRDLEAYNAALPDSIATLVTGRKQRFLQKNDMLAALGVPIKRHDTVPETFAVPATRRPQRIAFPKPQVHEPGFTPEPTLDPSIYYAILRIIHDAGKNLERLPSTYSGKKEEDLRDHLIITLEPHFQFEGSVTGETFNKTGKTDILIRYQNHNVFVAECKFWKGAKAYHQTIDQLLGYLTWRDSKAAVVLFDRNAGFSNDLATIETETPVHPHCLGFIDKTDDTWFNYRFHLPDDRNREVKVAVQAFHFPPTKGRAASST